MATPEAVTACSDLQSPVYCTKVTLTCWQGRPAAPPISLLPGNPALRAADFSRRLTVEHASYAAGVLVTPGELPSEKRELLSICFT